MYIPDWILWTLGVMFFGGTLAFIIIQMAGLAIVIANGLGALAKRFAPAVPVIIAIVGLILIKWLQVS